MAPMSKPGGGDERVEGDADRAWHRERRERRCGVGDRGDGTRPHRGCDPTAAQLDEHVGVESDRVPRVDDGIVAVLVVVLSDAERQCLRRGTRPVTGPNVVS